MVARPRTRPPLICSRMVGMASNITGTWPPINAVRASLLPLKGTWFMRMPAMAQNTSPAM